MWVAKTTFWREPDFSGRILVDLHPLYIIETQFSIVSPKAESQQETTTTDNKIYKEEKYSVFSDFLWILSFKKQF